MVLVDDRRAVRRRVVDEHVDLVAAEGRLDAVGLRRGDARRSADRPPSPGRSPPRGKDVLADGVERRRTAGTSRRSSTSRTRSWTAVWITAWFSSRASSPPPPPGRDLPEAISRSPCNSADRRAEPLLLLLGKLGEDGRSITSPSRGASAMPIGRRTRSRPRVRPSGAAVEGLVLSLLELGLDLAAARAGTGGLERGPKWRSGAPRRGDRSRERRRGARPGASTPSASARSRSRGRSTSRTASPSRAQSSRSRRTISGCPETGRTHRIDVEALRPDAEARSESRPRPPARGRPLPARSAVVTKSNRDGVARVPEAFGRQGFDPLPCINLAPRAKPPMVPMSENGQTASR